MNSIDGCLDRKHYLDESIIVQVPFHKPFIVTACKQNSGLLRKLKGKDRVTVAGKFTCFFYDHFWFAFIGPQFAISANCKLNKDKIIYGGFPGFWQLFPASGL